MSLADGLRSQLGARRAARLARFSPQADAFARSTRLRSAAKRHHGTGAQMKRNEGVMSGEAPDPSGEVVPMKQIMLHGPGDWRLDDVPDPDPGPRDAAGQD